MTMPVDEYVVEAKARLDRFEAWWREQQEEQPDMFPEEYDGSDWSEQFFAYCEGHPIE